MTSTLTLTLIDGVRIVVPDSLHLITPYVLLEQQDWFEDEIKFLRHLLQQGQKVIDIGANYGTYTLSMAQKVGLTGGVWSFEPASNTAKLLAEGIIINGFTQVILEQSALSSTSGTAQLSMNGHSELNTLVREGDPLTNASETVPLVTLDECLEKYGWQDIAFMKIDAEREESNILKGGKRFFAELSPLIQYEINSDMELVQNFAELGYNSYRLVPKLNLLVPFDATSTLDPYQLNLFCCKPDRAERLVADGFLLDVALTTEQDYRQYFSEKLKDQNGYDWQQTIAKLPYGIQLSNHWNQLVISENTAKVYQALSLYALSQDASLSSTERFNALELSFKLLNNVCEREPVYLRLASLARVARDYGARSTAVNALQRLINIFFQHNNMDVNEPFLAPAERFDSLCPNEALGNWVLAAVLEEYERLEYFSSFYSGILSQRHLEIIHNLGFGSEEMARRLLLLQKRFDLSVA